MEVVAELRARPNLRARGLGARYLDATSNVQAGVARTFGTTRPMRLVMGTETASCGELVP